MTSELFGLALLYYGLLYLAWAIAGATIAMLLFLLVRPLVRAAPTSGRWWLTSPQRARRRVDPRIDAPQWRLVATDCFGTMVPACVLMGPSGAAWFFVAGLLVAAEVVPLVRDDDALYSRGWGTLGVLLAVAFGGLAGVGGDPSVPDPIGVTLSILLPASAFVAGWRLLVAAAAQEGARIKAREALGLIPTKELV